MNRQRIRPSVVQYTLAVLLAVNACGCASRTNGPNMASAVADDPTQASAYVALANALDAIFDDAKYANAYWGVRVEKLDGTILYDRLGGKEFMPASNMKLFTTAASLCVLGADYNYTTRLEAIGNISSDGTLEGDIVIVGSGDPSLGAWHPDADENSRIVLDEWTRAIHDAGIKRISGDIVGDGRCFAPPAYSPAWEYGDLAYWYATGCSGLAIEENAFRCVISPGAQVGEPASIEITPHTEYISVINDTTTVEDGERSNADSTIYDAEGNVKRFVGSIALDHDAIHERGAVWNGPRYAAFLLREELDRQGVQVDGEAINIQSLNNTVRVDNMDHNVRRVLSSHTSPPLRDLARVVNEVSHNFFADQMLRTMGLVKRDEGSFEAGAEVVRAWLTDIGTPDPDGFRMMDGSGLSRTNLVQPRQICHVLRTMRRNNDAGNAFYASLPVGGMDGTLARRLNDPAVKGNVHAKTGYIAHARALSGYVTNADGQELVFSMICNQYTVPTREANASQDAACKVLALFSEQPNQN